MRRRRSPRSFTHLTLAGFATLTLLASTAAADWPMARHDPSRTGAATGKGDLTKPAVYWRWYVGGALSSSALAPIDVDGDAKRDLVFASAGRIFAKSPDDTLLWKTDALGVGWIAAIEDFDGDGTLDVVGVNADHALIFNGKTGALEWAEPDGEMGALGGIRFADLDGDKKLDLITLECGCCALNSGKTGFAYSFGAGFGAAKLLYALPTVSCGGGRSFSVVDVDGDGAPELVDPTDTTLGLVDGKTGAVVAQSPSLGSYAGFHFCQPADVDGLPGEELVCAQNTPLATPLGHRMVVLKGSKSPASFTTLWTANIGDLDGELALTPDMVRDLDGDGALEIVVSGKKTGGAMATYVLDAKTGATLATIPSETALGTAAIDAKTSALILTSGGQDLRAWSFSRTATPATVQRWTLAGRTITTFQDLRRAARTGLSGHVGALDLDGDGIDDLLALTRALPIDLSAYHVAGGPPTAIASFALPAESVVTAAALAPADSVSPRPALVVAHSDGFLDVLDDKLRIAQVGNGEFKVPATLRTGGYYAPGFRDLTRTPVVSSLDGAGGAAAQSVVLPDARSVLVRLDPKGASNASPPKPTWQRPRSFSPTVVKDLDSGKPGIVCHAEKTPTTSPASYQIVALDAAGKELWTTANAGSPLQDVVPSTKGTGTAQLVYQWGVASDLLVHVSAILPGSGGALWSSSPVDPGAGRQQDGLAMEDFDGDGTLDVVHQAGGTRVLSGATGAQIRAGGAPDSYFLPTIYDVDGDGAREVTLHAGYSPARAYKKDLSTVAWQSGSDDRPYQYGAYASCSGKPVFVEGSYRWPSRLRLTQTSTPPGVATTMVLASGKSYADETAAKAAGAQLGMLTTASTHEGLGGTGTYRTLVGSTDGFLYVLDPCAGTLVASYDFGAPVGESVFGDTDGDGRDEILVTVADGYLYDLRNEAIAAPKPVYDTDPEHGKTGAEATTTASETSLSGEWGTVTGAAAYEVAAVDGDGQYLTTPAWTKVGDVQKATISGLSLKVGATYRFAVRARNAADLAGPDAVSPGVTVSPSIVQPDAGVDDAGADATIDAGDAGAPAASSSGCGCRTPRDGQEGVAGLAATLALGLFAATRRGRRP
jgi:hypothetical protein